jgi:hypothetical protein
MRHLNFWLSESGNLESLDGFNQGTVFNYALVGDSTSTLKFIESQRLFKTFANYSTPNLPAMDAELFRALEILCSRCIKVFWFPATEMQGVLRATEVLSRMDLPWSERFLEFEGEDRGGYYRKQYLAVNLTDAARLLQNYMEIVEGLLSRYPNLYLVPVLNRFLGVKIPAYFRAYPLLKKLDRTINLDWLDPEEQNFWEDPYGHLSSLSWQMLRKRIEGV